MTFLIGLTVSKQVGFWRSQFFLETSQFSKASVFVLACWVCCKVYFLWGSVFSGKCRQVSFCRQISYVGKSLYLCKSFYRSFCWQLVFVSKLIFVGKSIFKGKYVYKNNLCHGQQKCQLVSQLVTLGKWALPPWPNCPRHGLP